MIKKSLFADELASSMQRELQPFEKKAAVTNLVDAVDYLHSAVEIFEEAGLFAKADQVLSILAKIAAINTNVRQMPNMEALMEAGVTIEDIKNNRLGDPIAKARLNFALKQLNFSDKDIAEFLGSKNVMTEQEVKTLLDPERSFGKINEYFKELKDIKPNNTIEFNSMLHKDVSGPSKSDDITFKSLLAYDEKNVNTVDYHSKGLTSDKMVANLKNHGTVFNMADDGKADDFLNLDINDAAMEVFEDTEDKTFEDND